MDLRGFLCHLQNFFHMIDQHIKEGENMAEKEMLKIILTASGINFTEPDIINE